MWQKIEVSIEDTTEVIEAPSWEIDKLRDEYLALGFKVKDTY